MEDCVRLDPALAEKVWCVLRDEEVGGPWEDVIGRGLFLGGNPPKSAILPLLHSGLLLLLHLLPETLLVGERVWQGVAVTHLAQPMSWLELRRFRVPLACQASTQAASVSSSRVDWLALQSVDRTQRAGHLTNLLLPTVEWTPWTADAADNCEQEKSSGGTNSHTNGNGQSLHLLLENLISPCAAVFVAGGAATENVPTLVACGTVEACVPLAQHIDVARAVFRTQNRSIPGADGKL